VGVFNYKDIYCEMKQLIRHILREHTREIILEMPKKSNQKEFIEKAKAIHGDTYDYSEVNYQGNNKNVSIVCPKHGPFLQTPAKHLIGQGCKKCGIERRGLNSKTSQEDFLKKVKKVHGDNYSLDKSIYTGANDPVLVTCKIHGDFYSTPSNLYAGHGCNDCAIQKNSDNLRKSNNEFVKQSKEIHGDKYDYSQVNYLRTGDKIDIICPKHGPFDTTPNHHLRGVGCPNCQESKGERSVTNILERHKIDYERQKKFDDCRNTLNKKVCRKLPFDFFIPSLNCLIEYDGEQHFRPVSRFGGEEGFEKLRQRDELKNQYSKKNGIKLIRIPYTMKMEDIEPYILKELGIK
jgi:hypothetical protein